MGTERKTLVVGDSWHRRVYDRWEARGGTPPARKNLCHYFWTVVLGAPLRWAALTGLVGTEWLTPLVIAVAVLGGLMTLLTGEFIWAAIFVGIIIVANSERLSAWCKEHENLERIFWWTLLSVYGIAFLGFLVVMVVKYGTDALLIMAAVPVAGVLIIGVCIGISVLWEWNRDRTWEKRFDKKTAKALKEKKPAPEKLEKKGAGAGSVLWAFLKAKKGKVCPFIDFTEETVTPLS